MRTEGQTFALNQLEEIAEQNEYAFEITDILEPSEKYSGLVIDTSLYCGHLEKAKGGLPLRERERFRFFIPKDFPLNLPSVHARHDRFAGWPHVQWKHSLCLYQSTQSEWKPRDGMYGYIKRLEDWLKHGALNELDPTGQPLHPPVAYRTDYSTSILVPIANTPTVTDMPWVGLAKLERINKKTLSIVEWREKSIDTPTGKYAAAILLPRPFPFEYPSTLTGLLLEVGVGFDLFRSILQTAFLWKSDEDPFLFIIGTPMRGVKGEEVLRQHLCAWEFDSDETEALSLSLLKFSKDEKLKEIGTKAETFFEKFMQVTKIRWCRIMENRSEIVTRRDHTSGLSALKGKTIAIWGCGAIGANIVLHLARAGAKKLILRDSGVVTPGILVRQPYPLHHVGYSKVSSIDVAIKAINNDIEVEQHTEDIKGWLGQDPDWSDGADLVIDCTASNLVHTAFELQRKKSNQNRAPVISMLVDTTCQKGFLVYISKNYTGGIVDVYRKEILKVCNDPGLKTFADAFYPDPEMPRKPFFQPEPGCSDPTFVGSASDSAALASLMIDLACKSLSQNQIPANAWFLSKSLDEKFSRVSHKIPVDYVTIDKINNYEVRVSIYAWNLIKARIDYNNRTNGANVETGGLLFGERDDLLKIIWVDSATEPPPDSDCSHNHFICGVEGTKELSARKKKWSRGLSRFVGTWHTHPKSMPFPSSIDIGAMAQILLSDDFSRKKKLLLIVRPDDTGDEVGGYLFDKSHFERGYATITNYGFHTSFSQKKETVKNIGLALSGGGSRAIAFHLGCLRALNDRDILKRVDVISSVSGGSVIAALYAYNDCPFAEFESRVLHLLRSGIDVKIAREFFHTSAWKKELYQYLTKFPISIKNRLLKKDDQLRRISYRTLCFIEALRKDVYGDKQLTDRRRNDVNTVINASELRTGTAFRFGSKESGCWRYGIIDKNEVSLAEAVALSAAYPLYLPSLDKNYKFIKHKRCDSNRVVLTDGGVFDNTGVSCMEPGRSSRYSSNVYAPDYIPAVSEFMTQKFA